MNLKPQSAMPEMPGSTASTIFYKRQIKKPNQPLTPLRKSMTTHHFQPTHYHTTIGPHAAVLHIEPGDRVRTTTVDARGHDASGAQATPPGNPMTGPFYINGAEPGDTLAMHLERITPAGMVGWSSRGVAAHVVDPGFVGELASSAPGTPSEPATWDIDVNENTATLRTPETKLGRLCLPLAPMLGCFGVAPRDRQSISTATSGPYGGNMDYRGSMAGAVFYFPVFTPGGLLFLGDGHAVQGDGEIAGTGIEAAMEVEFRVELIKRKTIHWPRGENKDEIFTLGNARPLDQALQHATTEMFRWLREDYGLDAVGVGLLMGQAVRYEVGNVFDPAYTVVCKMPKAVLQNLA
jgi:amidase